VPRKAPAKAAAAKAPAKTAPAASSPKRPPRVTAKGLEEYRRKRRFDVTPEPAPGGRAPKAAKAKAASSKPVARGASQRAAAKPLRFVIQKHAATRLHYDLRLEMAGVLRSWAVPKGPSLDPDDKRLAVLVEDHPLEYFDFEGGIPKGEYGGGTVMLWDWGTWEPLDPKRPDEPLEPERSFESGEVKIVFHGQRLNGAFTLVQIGRGRRPAVPGAADEGKNWLLIKKADEFAVDGWDAASEDRSVHTGRTMEEIAAGREAIWLSNVRDPTQASVDLSAARNAPMPRSLRPMLATLADKPFDDPDWLVEPKWDGVRLIAFVRDGAARFVTRNDNLANDAFPELAVLPRLLRAKDAIVDGEAIVLDPDTQRPSFARILSRINLRHATSAGEAERRQPGQLAYLVFDLVHLDGRDLSAVPLIDRKRLLGSILAPHQSIRVSEHSQGDGVAFFEAMREAELEGVVLKRATSAYQAGRRSPDWLKVKALLEQDFVIGGFTAPRRSRSGLGSLVVGLYDRDDDGQDRLHYAGHVGSGFDQATLAAVVEELAPLVTKKSPFVVEPKTNEQATWVLPERVARVRFLSWIKDEHDEQHLRAPVFVGLRDDVPPTECRREVAARAADVQRRGSSRGGIRGRPASGRVAVAEVARDRPASAGTDGVRGRPASATRNGGEAGAPSAVADAGVRERDLATPAEMTALEEIHGEGTWELQGRRVHLTNLDKVLFPQVGLTKRDLVRYYVSVGPWLLPYLRDRAVNTNPRPDGVDGPGFWQKQVPAHAPPWVRTWHYEGRHEKPKDYVVCDSVPTLAWLANLAAIDLHPWTSRIFHPEQPDWCLFDFDPAEGATFEQVVELVLALRTILGQLDLQGFPKVTGQSGIQVYVPLGPGHTFERSRSFAQQIGRVISSAMPELVTWDWEVARRTGKTRIDYTQNAINKTLAICYSVRPTPIASVSMPVTWEEIEEDRTLRPDRWTIANAIARIREVGDLFAPVLTLRQELPELG
jgi:bifunctional non-homologous end joining protein LigD